MLSPSYSSQAVRFLKKADKSLARRIFNKVELLCSRPVLPDAKPVVGSRDKLFRVRVGAYRILYCVDGSFLDVVKIGHRKNAFK